MEASITAPVAGTVERLALSGTQAGRRRRPGAGADSSESVGRGQAVLAGAGPPVGQVAAGGAVAVAGEDRPGEVDPVGVDDQEGVQRVDRQVVDLLVLVDRVAVMASPLTSLENMSSVKMS